MTPLPESEPDASARPDNRTFTGDRLKTLVYHLPEPDLFITINYQKKPEPYDWVIINEPDEGEIFIAIYDGQPIIGVVEIMEFYQLSQSEQWRPGIRNRFRN